MLRAVAWFSICALCATGARAQATWPSAYAPPAVLQLQPEVTLPERIAEREALLQSDFRRIDAEGKGRDWLLGGVLVIGAGLVAVGSAYPRQVGALLLPLGTIALVRGVVGLTLQPDPRVLAGAYLRMPLSTAAQARERIRYGERALAELARTDRRARILEGTLSCLVATSYVPLAIAFEREHDPAYRFRNDHFGYALLSLSVINVATSLVAAIRKTPNEQRYQQYRELAAQHERTAPGELDALVGKLSVIGSRNQVGLAGQLVF